MIHVAPVAFEHVVCRIADGSRYAMLLRHEMSIPRIDSGYTLESHSPLYDQSAMDSLQSRIAELEKDAARWLWLRDIAANPARMKLLERADAKPESPAAFDAAIDVLMAKEKEKRDG